MDDLLDYAFGTQQGLGTEIQLSVDEDGHLLFSIPRSIGEDDVALGLQGSSNLVDWVEVERAFVLIARVAAGAGLGRLICRSADRVSAYPERWFLWVRGDLL